MSANRFWAIALLLFAGARASAQSSMFLPAERPAYPDLQPITYDDSLTPTQATGAGEAAQRPATTQPPQIPSTAPPTTPDVAAAAPPATLPPPSTAAQRFSFAPGSVGTLRGLSRGSNFVMIGDLGPLARPRVVARQTPGLPAPFPPPTPPDVPGARFATMLSPIMRTIKISENQSPRPQDRIYYSFNFFEGANDDVNNRLGSPVNNMQVYRSIFGFEKTFNDGLGSVGLRLPLNTIRADQTIPRRFGDFGGTDTALGNLEIIGKYVLLENEETGNLLSGGLVIAPPTGPANFAGANYFQSFNTVTFQPYLGYIWGRDRFYFQGFSGITVPTDDRDVTLMYNDLGVGYFLRNDGPDDPDRFVSLVAPTFEVHINTPLNHRGAFNPFDPAATPDIVNLTYGLNVGFKQNALLTVGFVTPVTGPQPFDFEFMALFNLYFGGPRRGFTPPVLGGF